MGIREHRKRQREAKAAFLRQQQSKKNSIKKNILKQTDIGVPIATSSPKTTHSTDGILEEQGPVNLAESNTSKIQNAVTTPSAKFVQSSEQGPVIMDKSRSAVTTLSADSGNDSNELVNAIINKDIDTEDTESQNAVTETTDVTKADVDTQTEARHAVTNDISSETHELEQASQQVLCMLDNANDETHNS